MLLHEGVPDRDHVAHLPVLPAEHLEALDHGVALRDDVAADAVNAVHPDGACWRHVLAGVEDRDVQLLQQVLQIKTWQEYLRRGVHPRPLRQCDDRYAGAFPRGGEDCLHRLRMCGQPIPEWGVNRHAGLLANAWPHNVGDIPGGEECVIPVEDDHRLARLDMLARRCRGHGRQDVLGADRAEKLVGLLLVGSVPSTGLRLAHGGSVPSAGLHPVLQGEGPLGLAVQRHRARANIAGRHNGALAFVAGGAARIHHPRGRRLVRELQRRTCV
mmetsp:Transcript_46038/g.119088  ORF Transcript_46038/g.119088 Transcript_46038/m.119088 type:complete len:271 (+) Transcript_46038:153-965(+)